MVECVYSCDVRGAVIVHVVSGALVLNVTIAGHKHTYMYVHT